MQLIYERGIKLPPKKQKNKHSVFFAPLAFALVCAALIFVLGVFFQVNTIEVNGNSFYSDSEVAEASGVAEGDNLFFINRFSAASRIFAKLAYVEGVSIDRKLPSSLIIDVVESEAIACVETDNGIWAVDRTCKLLSKVSSEDAAALVQVKGFTVENPVQGEIISNPGIDTTTISYLSDMLRQISALNLRQSIEYIDMSNAGSPEFDFLGRFTVIMGAYENVPYKFQLLIAAVAGLQSGDCGTLDLSIDEAAHLTYD